MKRTVSEGNTNFQLNFVEELTLEHMDQVSAEQFRNFCIHVINGEEKCRNMNRSIEEQTEIKA